MAENSRIEWTHHTFNPWWGCVKVSPACKHCYAEAWAKRVGQRVWGGSASRRFFSDQHWDHPRKWQKRAKASRERARVFCASMADVFEDRRELDASRDRLWKLVEDTPDLDWLLLTKRPEHVKDLAPWSTIWPKNVWLGTTAESQEWADKRVDILARHSAAVRFLSCEPLLGPIDLRHWEEEIDWVIAGGESGPRARPMRPEWLRSLRDQCLKARIAFHFKQWGEWLPVEAEVGTRSSPENVEFQRLGKKKAGRQLDGVSWDQVPLPLTM